MKAQCYDYSISAIGDNIGSEAIVKALEAAGLDEIQVEKLLNFDVFVGHLPDRALAGFTERCDDWIRCWVNGGGDNSTGNALRGVCENDKSNNPHILAKALYDSIVGFTRKSFEASALVSTVVMECLNEE